MNKQKGNISVILLLLLAGAGLVFVGYKYTFKSKTPTVTPSPSSIETSDKTSDWKTYTNKKYKFSFNYPANWTIDENETHDTVESSNNDSFSFMVDLTNSFNVTLPILSWAKKRENDIQTGTGPGVFFSVVTDDKTLIAGEKPVVISSGNEGGEGRSYLLNKNNHIYDITLNIPTYGDNIMVNSSVTEESGKKSEAILYQILSTFKFTE